jgi:hypothetical protein
MCKRCSSCPDYAEDSVAIKEQTRDGREIPDYDNVGRTETYRLECVKKQHGHTENKNGYMMVASCLTKFDDVEVKRKCEVKLPYAAPFNIADNLPVTFTNVGQTYKNRYCAQCNVDHDLDPAFWHVALLCTFQFFSLE